MDYYFLDAVSWQHSQALYHAAAHLGREALFVLRPDTPYVCLGYHQDAQAEIDLDFAKGAGIPVFRREVGGGAVYLDGAQLFFQLIVRRDRPGVPPHIAGFYARFLGPVVNTFRDFGVPAEYKPVNDIVANGRKISGTGAAQVDDMVVLVGNFIIDFDYTMMARVLRVPDEKFRDKIYKTLSENLTTIRRETGSAPANADLAEALARHYTALLGPLVPRPLDEALIAKANELFEEMNRPAYLLANDRRRPDAARVKISEGVYVVQRIVKAPGGLIRATAISKDGHLSEVHLSGDFFFFPAEGLPEMERILEAVPEEREAIEAVLSAFYLSRAVESPGVQPADFAGVLAGPG